MEHQNVPNDPQQRLDFTKACARSLGLIEKPFGLNQMAELLDRETLRNLQAS